MAIAIKSIPILKGKAADNFITRVKKNTTRRASIDFTKQSSTASKILQKAKL